MVEDDPSALATLRARYGGRPPTVALEFDDAFAPGIKVDRVPATSEQAKVVPLGRVTLRRRICGGHGRRQRLDGLQRPDHRDTA